MYHLKSDVISNIYMVGKFSRYNSKEDKKTKEFQKLMFKNSL